MTKDELRALLSTIVPSAIADGRMYRYDRVGAGKVHDAAFLASSKPSAKVQVDKRRPSIKRTDPFTKRPYPTFKPHSDVGADDAAHPLEFSRHLHPDASILTPAFTCPVCEQHGANCTC